VIAIIIACLGILGLASYAATQRMKEISIRKILGASSGSIAILMAKEFILLVTIGFLLAVPAAWYFSTDWLQNFQYRIQISLFHFILAGGIAFGFALITIAYQTIKASRLNPADTLKME
jgi:putative ABC transport system permease protein